MTSVGIDQKGYLKKYLGIGKDSVEKRKKRKKSKKIGNRLRIIDDDVDARLSEEIQVDLGADTDEAPQIVSVIDDRPPSLRIDEETRSKLWKPIGASDAHEQVEKSIKFEENIKLSGNSEIKQPLKYMTNSSRNRRYIETKKVSRESLVNINKGISLPSGKRNSKLNEMKTLDVLNKVKEENMSPNHDFLPVRQHGESKDISSPRRDRIQISSDSDKSPLRRRHDKGSSLKKIRDKDSKDSPRSSEIDEDISPARKKKESDDFLPVRLHGNEDISPPRRDRTEVNSDSHSPPKKMHAKRLDDNSSILRKTKSGSSDNSPRSRIDRDISPTRKWEKSNDFLSPQKGQTKDMSATRQANADNDFSPLGRSQKHEDLSPPRRERGAEADSFPSRKIKIAKDEDNSPRRKKASKRSRWDDSEESNEKMEKTLDGKTAGLQYAADLVKETQELKKREDELFRKLSLDVSGANAATVVRRKKNEMDFEEERKLKLEQENKDKYNRWGRGLKQVDDVNEKIKNDLYEMSKPLARYADDEDLEKLLKNQERDGDPMLAYIRQKKRKKAVEQGPPVLRQYEGDAPPNRFGVRPGYRWDGVDRSNGYEKKWFEVQNSRKANIEESYKWSTEDM